MSAMIAAFGAKGHRYSTPNSSIMLHSVIIQSPQESIGRHTEMITYVKEDYRRKVADLAKRLRLTTKQLTELMDKTGWMSPKQAIKVGLIDRIWTPRMERAIDRDLIK
jgi:ATP-dependent protease ClpP protease subunit